MQLATSSNAQPWVCNVYYVTDEELNMYWLSFPSRRHSRELAKNPKAAITIAVKTEQPVIGVQAAGEAKLITEQETVREIAARYVDKHGIGKEFYTNFLSGKNKHSLYRFKPKTFVLFDEVHFPGERQQIEW